jgi:SAM-dependent methyltransferase
VSLHPTAQDGYTRAAAAYERGRPDYPAAAVGWLAPRLHLAPGRLLVDLGAGTGKLTRQLVPFGARVVAVEPVEEMARRLRQAVAGVEVLVATAASTGLPSGTVDAASAGQSFHWFADRESIREIHRILRPRGRLGLVWNRRDPRSELWREITELIQPYRDDTPDHQSRAWRRQLEESALFGPLESRAFPHEQLVSPEQLVDRVLSNSYLAVLSGPVQTEIRQRVLELAARSQLQEGHPLTLAYRAEVYACSAC